LPVRAVLYLVRVHPRYTAGRCQVYERYTVVRPVPGKAGAVRLACRAADRA